MLTNQAIINQTFTSKVNDVEQEYKAYLSNADAVQTQQKKFTNSSPDHRIATLLKDNSRERMMHIESGVGSPPLSDRFSSQQRTQPHLNNSIIKHSLRLSIPSTVKAVPSKDHSLLANDLLETNEKIKVENAKLREAVEDLEGKVKKGLESIEQLKAKYFDIQEAYQNLLNMQPYKDHCVASVSKLEERCD